MRHWKNWRKINFRGFLFQLTDELGLVPLPKNKYLILVKMFIDHLQYCLREIDAADRFIRIKNNDFYKKST